MTRVASKNRNRRAFTLIIVLLLIAATLATAFAFLRTQSNFAAIQSNHAADVGARNAAMIGLAAGLRQMSESGWSGVGSTISDTVTDGMSYSTTFTAGDPALTSASPDYGLLPLRVTVTSTGRQSVRGGDNGGDYVVRAVVELVPRKINATVFSFNETLYQWGNSNAIVNMPFQVQGDARIGGTLDLNATYPVGTSKTTWYQALKSLDDAGTDYRFVTGTLKWPASSNSGNTTHVQTNLNITTSDVAGTNTAPFSLPTSLPNYQLYPGGPTYAPVEIPGTTPVLADVSYTANPATNPLGLFYTNADAIQLNQSVTIVGTLLTLKSASDVQFAVSGTKSNVSITAVKLPGVSGDSQFVAYPAVVAADDIDVYAGQQLAVSGAMVAGDKFSFLTPNNTASFTATGQIACSQLDAAANTAWPTSSLTWTTYLTAFNSQRLLAGGQPNYALWLAMSPRLLSPVPKLVFAPNTSTVDNLVPDFTKTLYGPGASDSGGLRWRLISIRENP